MLPVRVQWGVALIAIVSRSLLSTIVALLLWSVLPNLVGFQTTTVMSGSMQPRLAVGDAIVVRHVDAANLAKGQVLLFVDPDHPGRLRMHRLVEVRSDGQLVTKGDANEQADSSTVPFDSIRGAAFLRVPYAGLPNYWFRTGQMLPLVASGGLVLLLVGGVRLGRLLEDDEDRERRRHRGVRRPGLHRATAAGAVVLALSGVLVAPSLPAQAAYSSATSGAPNTWSTMCGDVTPAQLASNPLFYWGNGTVTGTSQKVVSDLSGQSDPGWLLGDAVQATCDRGSSPSVSVGSVAGGAVIEQTSHPMPGTLTVATWFKTTSGGGVLADFSTGKGFTPAGGSNFALYMSSDGKLSFGGATTQVSSLIVASPLLCTTPTGYANGGWHLAVATWTNSSGCTLTVDGGIPSSTSPVTYAPQVSNTPGTSVGIAGYTGYWRFGYDSLSTLYGWSGQATSRFTGNLDEMQVYTSQLSAAERRTIFDRGH